MDRERNPPFRSWTRYFFKLSYETLKKNTERKKKIGFEAENDIRAGGRGCEIVGGFCAFWRDFSFANHSIGDTCTPLQRAGRGCGPS
ncbi:hypothetical protein EVAR_81792_1 [Eumeta japonica]|uniref:Uncharacterized protein n=1 Tax=Eumeta variegata TaxID=151549 RepID=A0A4C1UII8_EUMVA|nr:hypothetical protein EVAR_81792_1 [Eumeta japonica]